MINLETTYMGLKLKNPIIVSSSGLTNSVDKIKKIEANGGGAVVLKSLFEEQINYESTNLLQNNDYPEAEDYIRRYAKSNSLDEYLKLIGEAKKAVSIPVVASINCISASDWTDFARNMEDAGADGIELNIHIVPTDKRTRSSDLEQRYLDIVNDVDKKVKLPIAAKIGGHFTNLVGFTDALSAAGAKGIVLFNRFYEPNIDIENMRFTSAEVFSSPADIRHSLRWVGILSDKLKMTDLSASTGIHDGHAAIKQLLAGAKAIQIASVLYKNGFEEIPKFLDVIEAWMAKRRYTSLENFIGKMSYSKISNPSIYERAQFMRYFSSIE